MACIDSDGTLTPTGLLLLKALAEGPLPPGEIAHALSEPVFKVRGSLRELAGVDYIEEIDGDYHLTEVGRTKI